jgi:CheY-like chemotaxis protein
MRAGLASRPVPLKAPGGRRRVLIVEDNRDAATSLQMLLDLLGYDAAVAHSGREGVRKAGEWLPQVVLCDLGLPDLDGHGVAGELRRNPRTAGALLIAVTGHSPGEGAAENGFDHHLTKPVDPGELRALLPAPAEEAARP